MRRKAILLGIPSIFLLGLVGWNLLASVQQQRHEISLAQGYKIGGVLLKPGKYLVVHKEQGDHESAEACTFLYKGSNAAEKDLVAKLRCRPSQGPVVREFTMSATRQPDGTSVIRAIQFSGSTEIHNFEPGN